MLLGKESASLGDAWEAIRSLSTSYREGKGPEEEEEEKEEAKNWYERMNQRMNQRTNKQTIASSMAA